MDNYIFVVLIIAATILIILLIYRRQLRDFFFKANRDGLEARLSTYEPEKRDPSGESSVPTGRQPGVNISKIRQVGKRSKIQVDRSDTNVSDIMQFGEDQEILAGQGDDDKNQP
jgi:hypothetical protein